MSVYIWDLPISLPWPICALLSAAASFAMFTVLHDAIHGSISKYGLVNEVFGRASIVFLGPLAGPFYRGFRLIHLTHHKRTNGVYQHSLPNSLFVIAYYVRNFYQDPKEDPDYWSKGTSGPSLLLRWATQDISYLYDFLPRILRNKREIVDSIICLVIWIFVLFYLCVLHEQAPLIRKVLLWQWVIPSRLAVTMLVWSSLRCLEIPFSLTFFFLNDQAYSFNYLPHSGPETKLITVDRFKTTYFLDFAFLQPLFTTLMFFQDYHIVCILKIFSHFISL